MLPADPALRGRLFCAARAVLGWTQARVACEAGVPKGTVAAVEDGRRGERAAALPAIVGAFDKSGVRVGAGECPRTCGIQVVVHKLVPVPFSVYRRAGWRLEHRPPPQEGPGPSVPPRR